VTGTGLPLRGRGKPGCRAPLGARGSYQHRQLAYNGIGGLQPGYVRARCSRATAMTSYLAMPFSRARSRRAAEISREMPPGTWSWDMLISGVPPPGLSDLHPAVRLACPGWPLARLQERRAAGSAARGRGCCAASLRGPGWTGPAARSSPR